MIFTHFTTVDNKDPNIHLSAATYARLHHLIASQNDFDRVILYRAVPVGSYTKDKPGPRLIIQLYCNRLEMIEVAAMPGGLLRRISQEIDFSELGDVRITNQAMYVRPQAVPDPVYQREDGEDLCSYMVHYDGHADSYDAWLAHYLDHHPPIISRFPRLREYEIYTAVDWTSGDLPWAKAKMMQRNRLIFDSGPVLETSLLTEGVRSRLADTHGIFPKFHGTDVHAPLYTDIIVGPGATIPY
jgi:hypothetical protein